jgi:ATP-binding cassette, subfamily F, member 3
MSLLNASNLAKSFGPDDIFSGITLSVPQRARIAIVGPNGVGKTTLLRILLGAEEPSDGTVQQARSLSIGYLPQEARLTATHTLWEECLSAFEQLRAQEAELARLESVMGDPTQAEEALTRYGRLQEDFERQGGYTYETRIRQTLTGLGFEAADYRRPLAQLSGGQRTRALLARLLLSNPDLLVLDEPTNHLDIAAVEWLEGYLSTWEGTALIVSHDRYFLDKVVNTIWEMSHIGLETYRGNYSAYVQQRQERWELRKQIFIAEKERLEKELDYIRRNIAGQGTTQAKGRLRRLSRQLQAIEQLGFEAVQGKNWAEISDDAEIASHTMSVDEATRRIRALRGPTKRPPSLKLHLKAEQRSGNIVLRAANLVVGYPGEALFQTGEIELRRLECAAILGPNGAGKTTFLKTILGQLLPLAGEVNLGASLEIGYFAQAHEDLNTERTLVEEIESMAPGLLLAGIRDYLARFLFTGEDVFRKVATLSGGERGRLALAKLSLTRANLLLLDEPTNHLDIPSQEILQEVLAEFQGTILLVSHDRYLIDALATQIWEIDEERRSLRVFPGAYSEYRAQREAEQLAAEPRARETEAAPKTRIEARPAMSEYRRRARLQEVETQVEKLEARLAEITLQLENPPADPDLVQALGEDYVQIQNEIEAWLAEWEQLHPPEK